MSWYRFICTFILSIKTCSVALECCIRDLLSKRLEVICSEQAYVHKQKNRSSGQPWTSLFAANLEDVVTVQLNLGLLSVNIPIFPLPSLTAYWCWCPHKFGLIARVMNWKIYLKINLAPVSQLAVLACMVANHHSLISSVEPVACCKPSRGWSPMLHLNW